jgi:hypothetical protein
MSSHVMVPVGIGELFDKISILKIKSEKIIDPPKLNNVVYELSLLNEIAEKHFLHKIDGLQSLASELETVNRSIWNAENSVRELAISDGFGQAFANVARLTYAFNDKRAALKREINLIAGSSLVEEKWHGR